MARLGHGECGNMASARSGVEGKWETVGGLCSGARARRGGIAELDIETRVVPAP
jgi:hypothetical protein